MHARYYTFNLGRFMSVDPVPGEVGLSQSWNRYAYVMGNPLRMVDPFGRDDTDTVECQVGESCSNPINAKKLEQMMAEEEAANREADAALNRARALLRDSQQTIDHIKAAGDKSRSGTDPGNAPGGVVISLNISTSVGAGARGGGGTSFNLGLADDGGVSLSVAGTAAGGIETGGGATVGIGLSVHAASSAFDLNGSSVSSGMSAALGVGGSAHVTTDMSGHPTGAGVALNFGARGGSESGLSAYSTLNTTSTIVGWGSRRGFVLFSAGN